MAVPNAAAVATDAAGFLVLILAKIVLMQHIAIMMSFWMATIVLEGRSCTDYFAVIYRCIITATPKTRHRVKAGLQG